jgi:translation initiation factor 1 (eIF-1/SUI1)
MNKRFKELRRQATLVETYTSHDGSVHEGKSVDLEKFAELLVKECAKSAVLFADSTTVQGLSTKYIENYMLKHFGVE